MALKELPPDDELFAQIKQLKKIRRKKPYAKSRLDRYSAELIRFRAAGWTLGDIALHLRTNRRVVVARSTIHRWLEKNS